MDEINLARNREKWRAVVNTVMNLRFAQQTESYWLRAELLPCQKHNSMTLVCLYVRSV